MLAEVFYWVLNMSIVAVLMGLVVLALRSIRKLPRFFACCMWLVPLLRYWLPFALPGRFSLMTFIALFGTRSVPAPLASGQPELIYTNAVMAAESYFPIVYKAEALRYVFETASVVWLAGFVAALVALTTLYILSRMHVKDAAHVRGCVYRSVSVSSPAVYGIFRPRIILPEGVSESSLKYILLHEEAHIRRADNLWRILALLTACLHWFNPFSWVFLKFFFADMELACDARALKTLPESERKAYALALVSYAEQRKLLVSAFGGAKLKRRVQGVLAYHPLTLASALCFAALTAAVLIVLLTNAQG